MTKRRSSGASAFYRAYRPDQVTDLDDAIRTTIRKAEELGYVDISVTQELTGIQDGGNFSVGLLVKEAKVDADA